MIDKYNRNIDYIRISVTDRCNLRCIYCMPENGIDTISHKEILTYDEIVKLCKAFVRIGIYKIKITGGEPLVRKDIDNLIGQINNIDGIKSVTLTTNGVLLKEQLPKLMEAGLDGVNISIDSLNPVIYEKITKRDVLKKVFLSLEGCLKYKNLKIKVNCVPMQETEKEDLIRIAGLAKEFKINVRFIEMMPIGLGKNFDHYNEDEIISILEEVYGTFEVFGDKLGNGPAHYYSVPGFQGKIGFISAISHKFCEECNRVRLTSDGFLKTCLHYEKGVDLKKILRENQGDAALDEAVRQAVFEKPANHNFKECKEEQPYEKGHMSSIGG